MTPWVEDAIARALNRLRGMVAEAADFPHITQNGKWQYTQDGVWTGGFWAGLLWLAWQSRHEAQTLESATAFTDRLLLRAEDRRNHDLGFMFFPAAVKGWQLTGEQRFHDGAICAAYALAEQFNPKTQYIPGWGFFGGDDWSGSVLVDTLMNLPLLVWAVGRGADSRLMDVVCGHVETTLRHHLRQDGSVFHVYRFDPVTGEPRGGDTYQGFAPDSSWARGQSWAITALSILAEMTGNRDYLAASERVAAYFLDHLPADGVPPWDFMATGAHQPKDSAAGAIACYGLQKLFRVTGNRMYYDTASRLLKALASTCGNNTDLGGLLLHSTADLPHGLGIDESTMYGDFYYLKSLMFFKATGVEVCGRQFL